MSYTLFRNEPRHDKTNKMTVCSGKTRISLGIRPVWSESSLSAWRQVGCLATHWVHSEDSDQTGRMPRLIWVFGGRTLTLLVLSCGSNVPRHLNTNLTDASQNLTTYIGHSVFCIPINSSQQIVSLPILGGTPTLSILPKMAKSHYFKGISPPPMKFSISYDLFSENEYINSTFRPCIDDISCFRLE